MKISALIATGLLFVFPGNDLLAQEELNSQNFESALLSYTPKKSSLISQKDFNYGSMIIREMQDAVKNDAEGFNRADYFNVLSAFLTLEESEENIDLAFDKFAQSEGACEYFIAFEKQVRESDKYLPVRKKFLSRTAQCKSGDTEKQISLSGKEYAKEYDLDENLVTLMEEIKKRDQKHRTGEGFMIKQKPLDDKNQVIVDSLYRVYGKYVGESLVGSELESVMWAVIQHADADMMKRYLPVLQKAYAEGELALAPLKMTIDRYYAITEGFQVFGSQQGFNSDLADEEKREEIKMMYGIP
jgi:hypothetical protein